MLVGIADPRVNVPLDFEVEQGSPMLRAIKLERDGLIDRNGDRFGGRVAVVANVNRNRFKLHRFLKGGVLRLLRSGRSCFRFEGYRFMSQRAGDGICYRARSKIGSECESHDWPKTVSRCQSREVHARERRFKCRGEDRRSPNRLDPGTSLVTEERQLLEIHFVAGRRNDMVRDYLSFSAGCIDQRQNYFAILGSRRIQGVPDQSWNFPLHFVADERSTRGSQYSSNRFEAQELGQKVK